MGDVMHNEPARRTPIVEQVDVLVAGGGPAGIAAAIAAARRGASVRLIEAHGQLGGVWTTGLLTWILDHENKPGLMTEIMTELQRRDARRHNAYDIEAMKLLLERMCIEAGVRVRLHTRLAAAARDANNRMSVAITESKTGREAWAAKTFIDCTGDGDLAAQAGCGFDFGRPAEGYGSEGTTGETQPMTLMCLIGGVMHDDLHAHGLERGEKVNGRQAKDAMRAECERAGHIPSYGDPTLFPIRDDLHGLMANHEYGFSGIDAQQITDATLAARQDVNQLVDALRALGGIWTNVRIVATAGQIGVREGRRIRGRYTVTTQDLADGTRFDDAICRVTFGVDVHATSRQHGSAIERKPVQAKPYDIPLRSLIAADVDGLLMAGRCISGDFIAHSSYRVTGNAVAMGQAAGACAALAARGECLPHEVDADHVQQVCAAMDNVA